MCDNTVSYNAPSGMFFISVDEKCGNTDAYGKTLVCNDCKHDDAARDHRANARADRQSYATAGYGEL